jgi:hypothetical protein
MDEQSINWGDLLGTVVKTAGSVVSAKVDKPLSNAAQVQPVNQTNSASGNAAAAAAAAPASLQQYAPVLIGGGVLLSALLLIALIRKN